MDAVRDPDPAFFSVAEGRGFPEDRKVLGWPAYDTEADASSGDGGVGDGVEEEEGQVAKEYGERGGPPKGHPA